MAYLLFAGSACIALFACFFLVLEHKRPQHYLMVVAFGCLSWILFYFGISLTSILAVIPALVHSDISVTLMAAPAIYLIFISLMKEGKPPVTHYWPYFVFPVMMTVFLILSNLFMHPVTILRQGYPEVFTRPALTALNFVSDSSFTFYFALALFRARQMKLRNEITFLREFRRMVVFLIAMLINSMFLLSAYLFRLEFIFSLASVFYAIIVVLFCLVSTRMPRYILGPAISGPSEPAEKVPEKPLLVDDEIAILSSRLNRLMETKKLYVDSSLTLKQLARETGTTAHQLSWYLNSVVGKSFAEYLNGFRLESVCRSLVEKTDLPILEIALRNGFGSKTSFNALFLETYGVSPREYRKQHRPKEDSAGNPAP